MRTAQSLSIISLPAAEPSAGQLAGCSPPEHPALSLKDQQERWKAARARMGAPLTPKVPIVNRGRDKAIPLAPSLSQRVAAVDGWGDSGDIEWLYHGLPCPKTRSSVIRDILRDASDEFGFSVSDILGKGRVQGLVFARYVTLHRIARAMPHFSTPRLGRLFAMNHTSILFALGRLKRKPLQLAAVLEAL